VECLEEAIRIAPEYLAHHLELGKTRLAMGDRQAALAAFRRAAAIPPTYALDARRHDEAIEAVRRLERRR
jgi:tetratricopeptide (TPR) repeat protein